MAVGAMAVAGALAAGFGVAVGRGVGEAAGFGAVWAELVPPLAALPVGVGVRVVSLAGEQAIMTVSANNAAVRKTLQPGDSV